MFIKINLLSSDRISKEERTEFVALAYVLLALVTIGLLAGHAVKMRAQARIDARIARAQTELTKYQTIVTQVDALQATKQVLESRKNVIDALMASGLLYPVFMEQCVRLAPSGVGFRALTASLRSDSALDVAIDADALDTYSIADLIASLSADPAFSQVELGTIASTGGAKSNSAAFHITFQYTRKKT